ncbi:MAG TPA: hypothetical protein VMS54_12945 [Vicinamibacterales bacterium]|nr:hypothetical protein [Vicinamibacterales bacterium]
MGVVTGEFSGQIEAGTKGHHMAIKQDYAGMSDLERDIELEMDDEFELEGDEESGVDQEGSDNQEFEFELEGDDETSDQESDDEGGDDSEFEIEADARVRDQEYVEKFMEIASRTYESEFEVDQALNETLDGLAQERLFGGLKKLGKSLLKNKMLRGLAKKGLSIASGQFPALKAALSLAKGDLKGTLMNLGKQAITAAIPGSGAALGALNSLGFTQSESPEDNREAWENYVQMSGEAFEHLAANINPRADQPVEANRLATNAFQHAMKRAQQRTMTGGQRPMNGPRSRGGLHPGGGRRHGRVARITVKPGQTIVLRNARKIVVKG